MRRLIAILSSVFMAGSFSAFAQHLTIPTHTSSGEHGTFLMDFTYDDSGMSGDSGSANATNDTHNVDYNSMGLLTPTPSQFVEYDLGESHALTNLVIWNYNGPTWFIQGMKEVTIEVRAFGGTSAVVFSNAIPYAPAQGAGPTAPSLDIDLTGITGRFVRITTAPAPNQSWWADFRTDNDNHAALSEVRIYGDTTGLGNVATEACCFPDGSCADMDSAECVNAGGIPQGAGTECFLAICPQLDEACCFDDGSCLDMDPNICTSSGGTPGGPGTTCSTISCPQPEACCFDDGSCTDLLASICTASGGIAQGIFTTCATFPCPQLEACCFIDGTCSDLLSTGCTVAGGVSQGSATTCATASCVPATAEAADHAVEIGIEDRAGHVYALQRATSLNPNWAGLPAYMVGDGGQAVLVGDRDDPNAFYRYTSDESRVLPESRGFIGDTGSGWDTTSAVGIEASDERAMPSGGSWAGDAVFAINGNGVVGGGSAGPSVDQGKHISNNWNFTGDESDDTHWVSVTPANYGLNLHPAAPTGTILTLLFTFDQVYELDELHIYNALNTGSTDTGINEAEILVSTVNSNDRGDWTSVAWNAGDGIVDRAPGTDPGTVDEFVELDGASAQYLLLSVLSNHGAPWGTGAAEFRFFPVADPAPALSTIQTVSLGQPTGMVFTSVSGTVYELEQALKTVPGVPIGNPAETNGWSTTSAVSILAHSGERDTGSGGAGREIINTVNGAGMTGAEGDLHVESNGFGTQGMFANPPVGGGASAPNPGTQQTNGSHWVTYELDQVYNLDDIMIWNDNQITWYQQGWKSVMIQVSTNNGTNTSDWATVYNGELPLSSGAGAAPTPVALQGLTLGGIQARYVTLINTGLGGEATWMVGDDGSHAALAEVRFLAQGAGPPDVNNATFHGVGSFTVGDGGVQTLYDPQGWDPDSYWYRVVPK